MFIVRVALIIALFCCFFSLTTFAQDPDLGFLNQPVPAAVASPAPAALPADTAPAPAPPQSYLLYMANALGYGFGPTFLLLSIAAVAFALMNALAIRRETLMPSGLVEQFETLVEEKDYQGAYETALESDSFLGKVLAAGMSKMSDGKEQAVQEMQTVAEKETMRHEHRLSVMALIGSISPMIGLLGTVVGMIAAFQGLQHGAQGAQAPALAGGIATALITTQVALMIAIPMIIIYDIYKNKLAEMVLDVSTTTTHLMSNVPGFERK